MAETFDAAGVVVAATPGAIEGDKIGVNWTGDRKVSSLDFHFDFLATAGGDKIGEGRLDLSDGTIGEAIKEVYVEEVAAAVAAGIPQTIPDPENPEGPEIANPAYPTKPDVTALWNTATGMVGDGTALKPATVANFLATKKWGQRMLKKEWKKIAVS